MSFKINAIDADENSHMVKSLAAFAKYVSKKSIDFNLLKFVRDQSGEFDRLHHYTSEQGLLGIVKNKEIWATHVGFLNDASELNYGYSIFQEVEEEMFKLHEKECSPSLLDSFRDANIYNMMQSWQDIFIFCLSKDANKLSQWRAYANSSGSCSLEFDVNKLRGLVSSDRTEGLFIEVDYDRSSQKEKAKKLVSALVDLIATVSKDVEDFDDFTLAGAHGMLAIMYNSARTIMSSSFKSAAFQEENEVRLVFSVSKNAPSFPVDFRPSQYGLTPYLKIPLEAENNGEFPLSRVTIGPLGSRDLFKNGTKMLLQYSNLPQVEVLSDLTPHR